MRFFLRCFLLMVVCIAPLHATIESYDFHDESQRARYQQLTEELRCPKCQNQNLADSDSQIAADLRRELHQQLLDGKSDEAIIDFMRERYGDFVLYKPRMQANTVLLWLGPVALVVIVAGMLLWSRRSTVAVPAPPPQTVIAVESVQPIKSSTARWINLVSLVVLLAMAIGSLALYRHFGALQAVQITELGQAVFSGSLPAEQQARQQELLLSELDQWLSDHPDDEKFLYMRARLLSENAVWDRAAADYRNLVTRFPEEDSLLAEYAQVLYLQNNRNMTPDATAFLQQALQVNPQNVTALGLLGMHAFEGQDYKSAIGFWQRLLRIIPAGSPQAETINAGIARARELGGVVEQPALMADISLTVQVTIADRAQARPDEVVFVLLRAVNGPRMPLAVVKTTVAALANPVRLDTAQSPMRGQVDLSAIEQFEVVARLARSGQPMAAAGDWEGVSQPLTREKLPAQLAILVEKAIGQ